MPPAILAAGLILAAYLIGAVPFGLLIGRLRGMDIRQAGSGNIGATNVARLLGVRWGALALALDALKGMIPVLVAGRLLEPFVPGAPALAPWWLYPVWLTVGLACVVGHICPFIFGCAAARGWPRPWASCSAFGRSSRFRDWRRWGASCSLPWPRGTCRSRR